ncbi:MAG: hypothetical protein ACQEXB_00060 [Bacillota bacterium]
MKKYLIIFTSILAFYFIIQFVSGWVLTVTYKPDLPETWNSSAYLSNEVVLGGSPVVPVVATVILAVLAYLVVRMVKRLKGE